MFCGTVGGMENQIKALLAGATDAAVGHLEKQEPLEYIYQFGRESAFKEVLGVFRRFWVANGFPDAPHGTESPNRGSEGA